MKTDEPNLTADELEELCRLYMDCRLSVMEEKELEYVLLRTSLTSQSIAEVMSLMGIQTVKRLSVQPKIRRNFNRRLFSGIAAGVAVILTAAFYLMVPQDSYSSDMDSAVYIAAYSHGQRLNGLEAEVATNNAMARADSLMSHACFTERDYMMKANDIISETL